MHIKKSKSKTTSKRKTNNKYSLNRNTTKWTQQYFANTFGAVLANCDDNYKLTIYPTDKPSSTSGNRSSPSRFGGKAGRQNPTGHRN